MSQEVVTCDDCTSPARKMRLYASIDGLYLSRWVAAAQRGSEMHFLDDTETLTSESAYHETCMLTDDSPLTLKTVPLNKLVICPAKCLKFYIEHTCLPALISYVQYKELCFFAQGCALMLLSHCTKVSWNIRVARPHRSPCSGFLTIEVPDMPNT